MIISILLVINVIRNFSDIKYSKLDNVVQDKKAEIESSVSTSEPQIEYKIMQINGLNANILIQITDNDSGIEKVEYPSGHTVYCNGEEKRTKLAIDYEAELGGEYTFKITTKDGKETEKTIVVMNEYTVTVSNITTTGFSVSLSGLTSAELAKIDSIKYYVNISSTGTNYQSSNQVTGLSPKVSRYTWAEISYNDGEVKRSTNYRKVTTPHTHSDALGCYSEWAINVMYSLNYDANSGSLVVLNKRMFCGNCNKEMYNGNIKTLGNFGGYINVNNVDTYTNMACIYCYSEDNWFYNSYNSSSERLGSFEWGCNVCGKHYVRAVNNVARDGAGLKCCHSKVRSIICTNENAQNYSYNF